MKINKLSDSPSVLLSIVFSVIFPYTKVKISIAHFSVISKENTAKIEKFQFPKISA